MQKKTHITFGLFLGSIMYYFGLPIEYIILIGVTAFLPDIDWYMDKVWFRKEGLAKKIWYKFSRGRGMHRTILHNLWILIPLLIILGYVSNWDLYTLLGGFTGYTSHLLMDSLTKTGIYWLWPYGDERIFGRRRFYIRGGFVTGSISEKILQSIMFIGSVGVFALSSSDMDSISSQVRDILEKLVR